MEKKQTKNEKIIFAKGFCFYKLFWVFFISCFLGVILETIFIYVAFFRLENRAGLVWGPFNPIYGVGALVITILVHFIKKKSYIKVFIVGFLIGSVYEFLCSYIQELLLGSISWEYSNMPFNLFGRINLLYSLFWGVLTVVWVRFIYPFISKIIEKIPIKLGIIVSNFLVVFMLLNMLVSFMAVYRMTERKNNIKADNIIRQVLDKYYSNDVLKEIFPSMRFTD